MGNRSTDFSSDYDENRNAKAARTYGFLAKVCDRN